MADHIISPDGKSMWTGSEWIPAPPLANSEQNVSISDSLVMDNVNISNESDSTPTQSVKISDSVVSGDVNITNNNTIINVQIVSSLEKLSIPSEIQDIDLPPEQINQIQQVVSDAGRASSEGVILDATTKYALGKACAASRDYKAAKSYLIDSLHDFRQNGELDNEYNCIHQLGLIESIQGNYSKAEEYFRLELPYAKKQHLHGNENGTIMLLSILSNLIEIEYSANVNYTQAEILMREHIEITKKFRPEGLPGAYSDYLNILTTLGRLDDAQNLAEKALNEATAPMTTAILIFKLGLIRFDRAKLNAINPTDNHGWKPFYSPMRIFEKLRNYFRNNMFKNMNRDKMKATLDALEILLGCEESDGKNIVLARIYNSLGYNCVDLKKYNQGREYFHQAIRLKNSIGSPPYHEMRGLARLERFNKNFGVARRILNETIKEAEEKRDLIQIAHCYNDLGVLEGIVDVRVAEPAYLSALEIYRHLGHSEEKFILQKLMEGRRIMKDFREAENYRFQLENMR